MFCRQNLKINLNTVCDETQNLNDTDSETFFGTKFFRDRFRYHPKKCKNPGNGTRPGPKSTQIIWKISRLVPIFFFGTKFFRDRFRDFFRYLIFPRPVPRLFSVPIFFETGSETFFGTKFFRFRFRYHQKNWRIPGNGNSRDRDVTLWSEIDRIQIRMIFGLPKMTEYKYEK